MNIDGTGLRNLTNHPAEDQPEFSPDGKRLVFDSSGTGTPTSSS
jgi:Tol biopolymer transport system component